MQLPIRRGANGQAKLGGDPGSRLSGLPRVRYDHVLIRFAIRLGHAIVVALWRKDQPTHNNRQQPQPHRPSSLPTRLDRFDILRHIGEGIGNSE